MLVNGRLPDMYLYHALLHACDVINILPLKDLIRCPCIAKKWTTSVDGKPKDNSKGTQRGIRGMHLGFFPTQKCLLLYTPSTRQKVIAGDVICDETYASTAAETWRPFRDALALRPTVSFIPDSCTVWKILET
jgi:hypothetical protein